MKVQEHFRTGWPCLFCGRVGTNFDLDAPAAGFYTVGDDVSDIDLIATGTVGACRDCLDDLKAVKT